MFGGASKHTCVVSSALFGYSDWAVESQCTVPPFPWHQHYLSSTDFPHIGLWILPLWQSQQHLMHLVMTLKHKVFTIWPYKTQGASEHSLSLGGTIKIWPPQGKMIHPVKNGKIGILYCLPHFWIFYGMHSIVVPLHNFEKWWIDSTRFLASCFNYVHWYQQDRWCWWYG